MVCTSIAVTTFIRVGGGAINAKRRISEENKPLERRCRVLDDTISPSSIPQTVVCVGPHAVSEEKTLQKLYQTLNE
jgi:hypothetical protein